MLVSLGGFAVLGAAIGALYFHLLRVNAGLYLRSGPWWRPLALHLLRIAGIVAGFAAISVAGAGALLAAFGGFLLSRAVLVRPLGRLHG